MHILITLTNLVFICLTPITSHHQVNEESLETGWYHSNSDETGERRIFKYLNEEIYVNPTPIVTVSNFDRLEINETSWAKGEYILTIWLDKDGTEKWSGATELAMNARTNLVFILDNEIVSAPMVIAKMTNGATAITRKDLSKEDLEEIRQSLINKK